MNTRKKQGCYGTNFKSVNIISRHYTHARGIDSLLIHVMNRPLEVILASSKSD